LAGIPIAVIGGDGVGRELCAPIAKLLGANFHVAPSELDAGYEYYCRTGKSFEWETWDEIESFRGILFGATGSPKSRIPGYVSPILELRERLDLFVNIRPVKSRIAKRQGIDLVILRENIEGLYAGRERTVGEGEAIAEKVVTAKNVERLARFAFEYAVNRGRSTVTLVHKANVLKVTDGLFREVCLDVGRDYPAIEVREELVDAAAYHLVRDPDRFDVILTMNLYGDIISDLAAGLADGLGFAPSLSVGPDIALAEPTHGSAPDIAGKGIASPYAAIFSACLLLEWLGLDEDAGVLNAAAEDAISEGCLTAEAGGNCSTDEVLSVIEKKVAMKRQQAGNNRNVE